MAYFRILHLSDLHFSRWPRRVHVVDTRWGQVPEGLHVGLHLTSHDPDMLIGAARVAFEEADNLDLILITGDLATTGHDEDLAMAYRYLQSPAKRLWRDAQGRPTLRAAGTASILPGNHDRYSPGTLFPGCANFDEVFRTHWRCGQGVQTEVILEGTQGDRLAVVSADCSLRDVADAPLLPLFSYLGQGRAYPDIVSSLAQHTKEVRSEYDPVAVVWAIHFPPDCPDLKEELRLASSGELLRAAVESGVAFVLTGHYHVPVCYPAPGNPEVLVACAGSTSHCGVLQRNAFQLHVVEAVGSSVASVTNRRFVWDRERSVFKAESTERWVWRAGRATPEATEPTR